MAILLLLCHALTRKTGCSNHKWVDIALCNIYTRGCRIRRWTKKWAVYGAIAAPRE